MAFSSSCSLRGIPRDIYGLEPFFYFVFLTITDVNQKMRLIDFLFDFDIQPRKELLHAVCVFHGEFSVTYRPIDVMRC